MAQSVLLNNSADTTSFDLWKGTNAAGHVILYDGSGNILSVVPVGGNVAHDAADSGNPVKVGGKATAAAPTAVTEGDRVNAWFDLAGRLNVADGGTNLSIDDGGGSITVDGTLTADLTGDHADLDSGAGTDDHEVVAIGLPGSGGHVVGGTATNPIRTDPTGTTTQPVSDAGGSLTVDGTVAIDQTTPGTTNGVQVVAALPAGTNAIGKLAANSGVDIGDVDILSIAAGDNNIGNVDIASAIPAGANIIGKVGIDQTTPGTTNAVNPVTSAGAQVTGATDAAAPAGAVLVGGFDGTNLRGLRAGYGGAGNPAVGMLNVMPVVRRASDGTISTLAAAISAADADTGVAFGSASPMLWNDASFDRQRSNTEGTLLASAARTATAESAVQTNYNARGVTANIDVTAKAAATTLTVNLLVKDANGDYVVFASSSAFAAAAGTTYSVTFHPGVLAADFATNHEGKSVPVPRSYKIQVVPSDANSVTYAASQAQEV